MCGKCKQNGNSMIIFQNIDGYLWCVLFIIILLPTYDRWAEFSDGGTITTHLISKWGTGWGWFAISGGHPCSTPNPYSIVQICQWMFIFGTLKYFFGRYLYNKNVYYDFFIFIPLNVNYCLEPMLSKFVDNCSKPNNWLREISESRVMQFLLVRCKLMSVLRLKLHAVLKVDWRLMFASSSSAYTVWPHLGAIGITICCVLKCDSCQIQTKISIKKTKSIMQNRFIIDLLPYPWLANNKKENIYFSIYKDHVWYFQLI